VLAYQLSEPLVLHCNKHDWIECSFRYRSEHLSGTVVIDKASLVHLHMWPLIFVWDIFRGQGAHTTVLNLLLSIQDPSFSLPHHIHRQIPRVFCCPVEISDTSISKVLYTTRASQLPPWRRGERRRLRPSSLRHCSTYYSYSSAHWL